VAIVGDQMNATRVGLRSSFRDDALDGKVVLVTGGGRGIGRAIALAMASAGASVAICGRDTATLQETADAITGIGGECFITTCDVGDPGSVDAMGNEVLEHFDRIDSIVANAGISGPIKPLDQISPAEWRECIAIDLEGVHLTFRRFIPSMQQQRSGNLIAISSMAGKRPVKDQTVYAAAKMGVIGLVRSLAAELGPYGIRVNSVCPGAVDGQLVRQVIEQHAAAQGRTQAAARSDFTSDSPMRRMVSEDEVAQVCLFLASDASSGITGEDMNVSAGAVMY